MTQSDLNIGECRWVDSIGIDQRVTFKKGDNRRFIETQLFPSGVQARVMDSAPSTLTNVRGPSSCSIDSKAFQLYLMPLIFVAELLSDTS
jgi:hypothetical protein